MKRNIQSEAIAYLGKANLRQYSPQKRTVFFRSESRIYDDGDGQVFSLHVSFPWLTFGEIRIYKSNIWPLVFRHKEKWENLEEAYSTLHDMPSCCFNGGEFGYVCFGRTLWLLENGRYTTEELFWGTRNTLYTKEECIQKELDRFDHRSMGRIHLPSDCGFIPFVVNPTTIDEPNYPNGEE